MVFVCNVAGPEIYKEELPKVDLRTKKGREAEVMAQVEKYGGFSIFWACEKAIRASAIDRLLKAGKIVPGKDAGFPWNNYIKGKK